MPKVMCPLCGNSRGVVVVNSIDEDWPTSPPIEKVRLRITDCPRCGRATLDKVSGFAFRGEPKKQ